MPKTLKNAAVAASSSWTDPDGVRLPAGEVHAWERGTNQTVCGLPLHRSALGRFSHVTWSKGCSPSFVKWRRMPMPVSSGARVMGGSSVR